MRDYHLHELSDSEFESVVLVITSRILGIGVTGFSSGPDGGRDGRFTGKANCFPSFTEPWDGKWIIQSKHTENPIGTCSDRPFLNKFKEEELPRIKTLLDKGELEIYLLVTNRKKSGNADANLVEVIRSVLEHGRIAIIGLEDVSRHLDGNRDIAAQFNLNSNRGPLLFVPDDLVSLINAFSAETPNYLELSRLGDDFSLTQFDDKNELNNVSDELAESIEDDSMPYFEKIGEFLEKPQNDEFRLKYYALTNEIKQKLIAENAVSVGLAVALAELYDVVIGRHPELRHNRRLITVFLHYMYYACDIGRKNARRSQAS